MRESNFSFPSLNKACVSITSALYDRRALDCTAVLPLVNSLSHLNYLTSSSNRIREILITDGGLERLVRILHKTKVVHDTLHSWQWTMAFQCVVNMGVRGTPEIRARVVEVGIVPVLIEIFNAHLQRIEAARIKEELQATGQQLELHLQHHHQNHQTRIPKASYGSLEETGLSDEDSAMLLTDPSSGPILGQEHSPMSASLRLTAIRNQLANASPNHKVMVNQPSPEHLEESRQRLEKKFKEAKDALSTYQYVMFRTEDVVMSLQLLAYISKYPQLRAKLSNMKIYRLNGNVPWLFDKDAKSINVFELVEKFTFFHSQVQLQHWAAVVMGNNCRKDESRDGRRQCANLKCLKWEDTPRQFAKCRRCRKAKYCSKECQSEAWKAGHRHWCSERSPTNTDDTHTSVNPHHHRQRPPPHQQRNNNRPTNNVPTNQPATASSPSPSISTTTGSTSQSLQFDQQQQQHQQQQQQHHQQGPPVLSHIGQMFSSLPTQFESPLHQSQEQ